MKRISVLLIVITMFCQSFVIADSNNELTIEKAIELALAKAYPREKVDAERLILSLDLSKAKARSEESNLVVNDADSQAEYYLTQHYYVKEKENALAAFDSDLLSKKRQTKLEIMKEYWQLKSKKEKMTIASNNLEGLRKDYTDLNVSFDNDYITLLEYEQKKSILDGKINQIEALKISYLKAEMLFNQKLGLPVDTSLDLVSELDLRDVNDRVDYQAIEEYLLAHDENIIQIQEELSMMKLKMSLMVPEDSIYGYPNGYLQHQVAIKKKGLALNRTKEKLLIDVKERVYDIMNQVELLSLDEMELRILKEKQRIIDQKLALHLLSTNEYNLQSETLKNKQTAIDEAKLNLHFYLLEYDL